MLVMDVDGVLTNGDIIVDHAGEEIKKFNVLDGFGIVVLHKLGYKTAIISARSTKAVEARAADLKIDKVYQDAYPKLAAYEKLLREFALNDEQVCFIGDDLPDLMVLKRVGLAVAVSNAVSEVKEVAHYVTQRSGGNGAVREVVELILKTKGEWKTVLEQFSK
jgi:3-deoxy-D-manno-octulosonate 8-phosphate phosphatase (KDO 8-P phosphatase)